jgi:hypothetical protein
MGGIPVSPSDVVEPQTQEEGLQAQLRIFQRDARGVAGATEVAKGFIVDRRHVHRGQVAGAQEPREFDGVAPVGLDLVPRPPRDEGRRHHVAGQPFTGEVSIPAIAARPSLVGKP